MTFYDAIMFQLGKEVGRTVFALSFVVIIFGIGMPAICIHEWMERRKRGRS